jgi:hypothetical protein
MGPEPALGVSRQSIRKKIQCWLDKQHLIMWQGLAGTQRQARELISVPCIAAKTKLLSFNRTQSRVVVGLLTGHNTLRRHLHIMGISEIPCVGDVEQRRKPQLMFCVNVKPWQHIDTLIWVLSSYTLKISKN